MSNETKKLYAERDAMELDQIGGHYFKHVMAMTSESLHSKSDIAAELGWRDCQIEQLEQQLADSQREFRSADATIENLQMQVEKLAAENAGLKSAAEFATAPDMWVEQADGMLDYRYCEWYVDVLNSAMETPATDALLAEVRAQGVEMAANALDSVNQFNYANMLDDIAQKLRQGGAA